ncbi:MAG: ATP synthase F0 subunit C [Candidatus Gracilibacteria bacterium]|nr:ATP synthase F0 subunit C [Candidatus Gracilibacteria bacterium]
MDYLNYVGPGLAVGLAGVGVAIGQGILAKKAMEVMGKSPAMITFYLTVTILGIALVESAVIYGLVVAFTLLDATTLPLYTSIGAGTAIGLAGLGAGIGEGQLIAGALSAMDRNPQIKGKIMTFMVLFVALVEVTAIYGLIVAFSIIEKGASFEPMYALAAGLAIGLAGVGVAIGRGYMSEKSLEVMGQNPKMISFFLTVSILGVALIESAAIYAMIVSFTILDFTGATAAAMAAGLAIGFTGLGAGLGEGLLIKGAMESINRSPETKGKIMAFMVLFVALIEVVAIYGLIVSFTVLGSEETAVSTQNTVIEQEVEASSDTVEVTE